MDAGVKSKRPQMAPGSLKRLQEVCKFTTETLKFEMIEMFFFFSNTPAPIPQEDVVWPDAGHVQTTPEVTEIWQ